MASRSIPLAALPFLCLCFAVPSIPTRRVLDYALKLKDLFRQDEKQWADVPHFAALCCGFPDGLIPCVKQVKDGSLTAAESVQHLLQWLKGYPESNFIWMWNPSDHQTKEHHPEAMLVRLAIEAHESSSWRGLQQGSLLLYSHKCPCQSCAQKIEKLQDVLAPALGPLTLCVGLPVRSHIFESLCGTSDRLVYQQLRKAGVRVLQLPLRHSWSPKRRAQFYRRQAAKRRRLKGGAFDVSDGAD